MVEIDEVYVFAGVYGGLVCRANRLVLLVVGLIAPLLQETLGRFGLSVTG